MTLTLLAIRPAQAWKQFSLARTAQSQANKPCLPESAPGKVWSNISEQEAWCRSTSVTAELDWVQYTSLACVSAECQMWLCKAFQVFHWHYARQGGFTGSLLATGIFKPCFCTHNNYCCGAEAWVLSPVKSESFLHHSQSRDCECNPCPFSVKDAHACRYAARYFRFCLSEILLLQIATGSHEGIQRVFWKRERSRRVLFSNMLAALLSAATLDSLESNAGQVPEGGQQLILCADLGDWSCLLFSAESNLWSWSLFVFVMIRERPISESLTVQQSTFPLMFSDWKLALSSKFIFKYFILFTRNRSENCKEKVMTVFKMCFKLKFWIYVQYLKFKEIKCIYELSGFSGTHIKFLLWGC